MLGDVADVAREDSRAYEITMKKFIIEMTAKEWNWMNTILFHQIIRCKEGYDEAKQAEDKKFFSDKLDQAAALQKKVVPLEQYIVKKLS